MRFILKHTFTPLAEKRNSNMTLTLTRSAAALAALVLFASCATTPVANSPSAPVAEQEPQSVSTQTNGLTAMGSSPKKLIEPTIRVGLLSDQSMTEFRRIEGGYIVIDSRGAHGLQRGFSLRAPLAGAAVAYAVQAAAISDSRSAEALAARMRKEASVDVDVIFDAATGMYKIFAGNFPDAAAAEPLRGRLIEQGHAKETIVARRPAVEKFQNVIELIDDEGGRKRFVDNSILIFPAAKDGIEVGGVMYRGAARALVNPRGLLNIINEINFDDYVRGVVPNELGPRIYDELEAIKAQTIAARTYAFRRVGEYRPEGFDICPTPACQVYKGMNTEDPMSDQAVRETAGMVMVHGTEVVDALFTSTCGGETSDVGTMFPGRSEPYLKRARCVEHEMVSIPGRADSELLSDMELDARVFSALTGIAAPAGRRLSGSDVTSIVASGARLAGYEMPAVAAASSGSRGEVLRYLSRAWKLKDATDTLLLPEDRRYFFPQSENDGEAFLAASFLIKYRIVPPQAIDTLDLSAPMLQQELMALVYSWMERMNLVAETTGKVHKVDGRQVTLKAEGKLTSYTIGAGTPMFRRFFETSQEYRSLPVMIGDRMVLVQKRGGGVLAGILNANYDGASFDRTSSYADWTRSYREDELVTMINRRNAIRELVDIKPLEIDASHRIAKLQVTAEGGRTFVLEGLPVRWSLGVPDNLFVYAKTRDSDGADRYTFYGKGWGHGVGMCQVGAYVAAFRGWSAERILKHYYTGVEIVPMTSVNR